MSWDVVLNNHRNRCSANLGLCQAGIAANACPQCGYEALRYFLPPPTTGMPQRLSPALRPVGDSSPGADVRRCWSTAMPPGFWWSVSYFWWAVSFFWCALSLRAELWRCCKGLFRARRRSGCACRCVAARQRSALLQEAPIYAILISMVKVADRSMIICPRGSSACGYFRGVAQSG